VPCYVYILRCIGGSLYVGSTNDLSLRLWRHNAGIGASYTARRQPVALVYSEEFASLTSALNRERQIKRWTHAKKEALIRGAPNELRHWSVRARGRQ
jgi:putative endonuclease